MKQSCAGNMIWRQVKQRMARVKLHLFLFHLKFVKMKMFFTILALKQSNSVKRIFAVYKYSRRLLKRTLWPKFLSNNLSLWLFYDWLTFSQNLIFSNLILHNFILVSKSNSSVSKLFIFTRIRCAWICIRICINIRYRSVKFRKPVQGLVFFKGDF